MHHGKTSASWYERSTEEIHSFLRQYPQAVAGLSGSILYETANMCKLTAPKNRKFRFKNKLLSLDSSTISLCLALFPWAEFRTTKGAVKLHLLLDHDGYFPSYAYISNGKKHDVTIARKIPLPPGSIVTMDRGYNEYKLFGSWTEQGIFFVTRLKENADYTVLEENLIPTAGNVLRDQLIRFNGFYERVPGRTKPID